MKRSALKRTETPWAAKEPKPALPDPITPLVRGIVRKRSGNKCELCGGPNEHAHHRQSRRAGDHSAANVVATCLLCHRRIHGHVQWATDSGWIVSAYEPNPASVPILRDGEWVKLDRDGKVTPA